jgi:hypothetical protein
MRGNLIIQQRQTTNMITFLSTLINWFPKKDDNMNKKILGKRMNRKLDRKEHSSWKIVGSRHWSKLTFGNPKSTLTWTNSVFLYIIRILPQYHQRVSNGCTKKTKMGVDLRFQLKFAEKIQSCMSIPSLLFM